MSRQAIFTLMTLCMFVLVSAVPVNAQLPGGCSSTDQKRVDQYTDAAVNALVNGNLARFDGLTREIESGLSKTCRAALDREQPIRVRCTADERKLVLQYYDAILLSILNMDLESYFDSYENLEGSVSSACWLALNQHDDPRIRRACSAGELDLMASYAGPVLRATKQVLLTGDLSEILQLSQQLTSQLSSKCYTTVAQVQQEKQVPKNNQPAGNLQRPPRVYDHGGGTFSVPGLGACTPGGCMSY